MCLGFSTTVKDAHCSNLPVLPCTVRRMVPNSTSPVAHPFPPPQQVDTQPGKSRPSPTWPPPTAPAGSGPAGSTQETPPGLSTPLFPPSAALPEPRPTEGEPRSWRTHHPAMGNPPAAPPSPHAKTLRLPGPFPPPWPPEPAQSEPPHKHPHPPQGCWGRAPGRAPQLLLHA